MTDDILLLKNFYKNNEIVAFVDSIKPFLYILLAFSLLYAGYLLIFNKKFNREGMIINIFIACAVIMLLGTGMDKAGEFTDSAVNAVKVESLYPNDDASLSGSIIQRNVTDLSEFDKSKWSTTELNVPNSTPPGKMININIREKYGQDTDGISSEGQGISKYLLSLNNVGEYKAVKLDQSGLEWNNEYYFRYSVDWFTIIVTLGIIGFTLFSIALKLARLFFELTFNYILALIIAPADIHDGQKTKKIIQSILNTFMVIIMIFLSMKVYMIGTAYLENTLPTITYLVALIAFSLAVIDGPNMVERLFGIDAGLKSGWSTLAGAYAGAKVAGGIAKGTTKGVKGLAGMMGAGKDKVNQNAANSATGEGFDRNKESTSGDMDGTSQVNNGSGNSLTKEMEKHKKKQDQRRKQGQGIHDSVNMTNGNLSGTVQNANGEVAAAIKGKESVPSVGQQENSLTTPSIANRNGNDHAHPNRKTVPSPNDSLPNNQSIRDTTEEGTTQSTRSPVRYYTNGNQTAANQSNQSLIGYGSHSAEPMDIVRNNPGGTGSQSTEQTDVTRNNTGGVNSQSIEQIDTSRNIDSGTSGDCSTEKIDVVSKPNTYLTNNANSTKKSISQMKYAGKKNR